MRTQKGFTLVELVIYVGIFALVAGFFTSILLISLRVQGTQTGLVEVSTQLNFAMQQIQRHVQEATSVTSPAAGASANSLSLSKPSGNVTIFIGSCGSPAVNDAICVTEGAVTNPITTSKIKITDLNFAHYSTPSNNPATPAVETVKISLAANNITPDPATVITRSIQGSASPLNQ